MKHWYPTEQTTDSAVAGNIKDDLDEEELDEELYEDEEEGRIRTNMGEGPSRTALTEKTFTPMTRTPWWMPTWRTRKTIFDFGECAPTPLLTIPCSSM